MAKKKGASPKKGKSEQSFGQKFLKQGLGIDTANIKRSLDELDSHTVVKSLFGPLAAKVFAPLPKPEEPNLDTPETVGKESNPTLSSIEKQLKALIKTATKIGAIDKEIQNQLLQQLRNSAAAAREQELERSRMPEVTEPVEIGPSETDVTRLEDAIKKLSDELDHYKGGGLLGGLGNMLGLGGGKSAVTAAEQATKAAVAKDSKGVWRYAAGATGATGAKIGGQYVGNKAIIAALKKNGIEAAYKGGMLRFAAGAVNKEGAKVGGQIIGDAVIKQSIERAAGPIVKKSFGKALLKGIPGLGWVLGGLFALPRLLRGDYVGAGLEVGSSVGSWATALPMMTMLIAKDVYSDVYGISPEMDPLASSRMPVVKNTVADMAAKAINSEKGPRPGASTPNSTPSSVSKSPATSAAAASGTAIGGLGNATVNVKTQAVGTPVDRSAATPSSSSTATSAGTASSSSGTMAPPPSAAPAQLEPKNATRGQSLNAQSAAADAAVNLPPPASQTSGPSVTPFRQAVNPTSRANSTGVGDVPEPTYNHIMDLFNVLYFEAAV